METFAPSTTRASEPIDISDVFNKAFAARYDPQMIATSYKPKKKFMQLAIAEAKRTRDRGDYAIGAVVTRVTDASEVVIASAGNRVKTSIKHQARGVGNAQIADGLVTAPQLSQRPQSMFPVVNRSQHPRAQQVGQLASVHVSLLLPSFNKALRRGSQTNTCAPCACNRS